MMKRSNNPETYEYDAFISYSRKDKIFASKLESALEDYKAPKDLDIPQRPLNIFRDEEDMLGAEYYKTIDLQLRLSAKLIVICSPNSRRSDFVNDEILRFVKNNSPDNIIPVIIAGIPNHEANAEQEAEKAFPNALLEQMTMPLAKDYRDFNVHKDKVNKSPFENAWYGLLSDIYNKSRREIEERDKKKQVKQRRIRSAIVAGVMIALTLFAGLAWWQRNIAVEARDAAESTLSQLFYEKSETALQQNRPHDALHNLVSAIESKDTPKLRGHFLETISSVPTLLWDSPTPALAHTFAINEDATKLATISNNSATIWNLKSFGLLNKFEIPCAADWIAYMQEDSFWISCGNSLYVVNSIGPVIKKVVSPALDNSIGAIMDQSGSYVLAVVAEEKKLALGQRCY